MESLGCRMQEYISILFSVYSKEYHSMLYKYRSTTVMNISHTGSTAGLMHL